MKVALPISLVVPSLLLVLSGTWARGQDLPAPLPVPVDQPAYQPVKALIEREQRCAAELEPRRAALNQAQGKLFLTDRERDQYLAEKRRALDEATACHNDAHMQLVQVALPKLEAACVEIKASTCAQWAQNQRLWRLEIQSVRRRLHGCNEDKGLAALQHQEQVVMSSAYPYAQKMEDLAIVQEQKRALIAAQRECVSLVSNRINALEGALAGRDPAAEARAREAEALARKNEALARKNEAAADARAKVRAHVHALMSIAQKLVANPEQLTFDSFRESLNKLAEGLEQATIRPVAGDRETAEGLRIITSATESLRATEAAWRRERALQGSIERLTQERDAARVNHAQRHNDVSQIGLDIAEQNLRRAIEDRERAKLDRETAWRAAERLVKGAPWVAEDTQGSEARPR